MKKDKKKITLRRRDAEVSQRRKREKGFAQSSLREAH
jgi:hypothetical protein